MIPILEITLDGMWAYIANSIMPNPIAQGIILFIILAIAMIKNRVGVATAMLVGMVFWHTLVKMYSGVFNDIWIIVFSLSAVLFAIFFLFLRKL